MKERFVPRKDIPSTGWTYVGTVDNIAANFVCVNCEFPHVRYVHRIRHKESGRIIGVGCTCAQHLTEDFATPRLREKALKGLAGRRMRWPTLSWKESAKGNLYLRKQGLIFVVKLSNGKWKACYKKAEDDVKIWTYVQKICNTPEEAKLAAFDSVYVSGTI